MSRELSASRENVSVAQVCFLLVASIIVNGHFVYVRLSLDAAGNDAWMAIFPAVAVGWATLWAVVRLAKRHPGYSLTQISIRLLGPWLGRLASLPLILLFMQIMTTTTRIFADFLPSILPRSPDWVLSAGVAVLAGIVILQGVEVGGRCGQFVLPFLVLLGIMASVLLTKDKHPEDILPAFAHSARALAAASLPLTGLFAEMVVAGMFLGNVRNGGLRSMRPLLVVAVLGVMFIGPLTGPPMVFGPYLATAFVYPTFEEIRYIQVSSFVARMDIAGLLLWTGGSFLRLITFLYALSRSVSDWCRIENYRSLVMPLVALSVVFAVQLDGTSGVVMNNISEAYAPFSLVVGLVIPWLLVSVDAWKGRTKRVAA